MYSSAAKDSGKENSKRLVFMGNGHGANVALKRPILP
jgi:hypothetical protein